MRFQIALLPGDGIGPEVTNQAVAVLETIGRAFGHKFKTVHCLAGGCAVDAGRDSLPRETLKVCQDSDAVLLGAVGGPQWDGLAGPLRPEAGLLRLRKSLGLFANLRPAVLHQPLRRACPLRADIAQAGIDVCIVRELTGGIYFGHRGRYLGPMGEEAFDTEAYNYGEVRRIARKAFEVARGRGKRLVSVDKANILESSRLWRGAVEDTAREYPDIALSHMYVDNAAMQLIRRPQQFDVLLTSNMFGDILSDEAGMLTGSIGMLPSASLGDTRQGLYEPVHGSAPDIAGQDKANPAAAILSAALMLRYSFGLAEEAAAVERAVGRVLEKGYRTPDIAEPGAQVSGTTRMGQLVALEISG